MNRDSWEINGADGLIAATTQEHELAIVTRNEANFANIDELVIVIPIFQP